MIDFDSIISAIAAICKFFGRFAAFCFLHSALSAAGKTVPYCNMYKFYSLILNVLHKEYFVVQRLDFLHKRIIFLSNTFW